MKIGKKSLNRQSAKFVAAIGVIMLVLTTYGSLWAAVAPNLPSDDRMKQLVNATMRDFMHAVNTQDFTDFYESIAALWKVQTTKEAFAAGFKSFIGQQFDVAALQDASPTFSPAPKITDGIVLNMTGSYPLPASMFMFRLRYVYEYPAWKLIGINIQPMNYTGTTLHVGNPKTALSAGPMPSDEQFQQLVQATVADLIHAVKQRDFSEFYAKVSGLTQAKYSQAKLTENLSRIAAIKVDLSALATLQPVFDKAAEIAKTGILTMELHYATSPMPMYFNLRYVYEEQQWKLLDIGVELKSK